MIVYRFERNGIGPYVSNTGVLRPTKPMTRTEKKYSIILNQHLIASNIDKYPAWVKAHGDNSLMYGCPSKELLRAYFCGDFKSLFKIGFRIKRYVVPDNEIIDIVTEVAFPVKYHKLQNVRTVKKKINTL
jgi:hypothetical protein